MSRVTIPRYYTTSISVTKTISEIVETLSKYGVRSYAVRNDEETGDPVRLRFEVYIEDLGVYAPAEISARIETIYERLQDAATAAGKGKAYRTREHAARVAWRQLLAYVEVVVELAESGVKPLHELLLGDFLYADDDGRLRRFGDLFLDRGGERLLAPPTE